MNICKHDEYCGGCIYQGVPYEEQLKIKEKQRFFMLQYIPCILWLESRRTIKFEIAAISKSGFENPYFLWEIIILFRCPIIR